MIILPGLDSSFYQRKKKKKTRVNQIIVSNVLEQRRCLRVDLNEVPTSLS